MPKFYRDLTEYAYANGMCRQTASKRFKKWELGLVEVPKGMRYMVEEK